jgi:hypothetical protein
MTTEYQQLEAAIAALETQRATLGDTVLELATAPLRARLAALLRPAGLKHRLHGCMASPTSPCAWACTAVTWRWARVWKTTTPPWVRP